MAPEPHFLWARIDGSHALRITRVDIEDGELVIPGTITVDGTEHVVREIGPRAFEKKRFTTVSLPDSMEVLGDRAFAENPALVHVYYASATPPRLGDEVFAGCDRFREMEHPEPRSWFWTGVIGGIALIAATFLGGFR
jgi:hypothetical protein